MRSILAVLMLASAAAAHAGSAQDFDFWVGSWELTWPKDGAGINVITKMLDDKVILEAFDGRPSSPLVGRSVSVYDPKKDVWRQTWVDNQGGYLDFVGRMYPDGRMILGREAEQAGKAILQRMVWFNISTDSFDWHWEQSSDGGQTWTVQWPIHYRRAGGG